MIFTFIISFSLYSQSIIGNFESEMNEVLNGNEKNSWELTIRVPDSKFPSRLIVGIVGETNSSDAAEIYNSIDGNVNISAVPKLPNYFYAAFSNSAFLR